MAHHVAIMKPSWKLISKILTGDKSIESRWYQSRRAPWDTVKAGDVIFFKDSGKPVTARAEVAEVLQFTFESVDEIVAMLKKYGPRICLVNKDPHTWPTKPRYAILMILRNPQAIAQPFNIDKTGFGAPAAWLTVPNISAIKI